MEHTCLYTLILPQSFPRRPHVSPHAPFISAETYFSSVSKGKNGSVQQKSTRRGITDTFACLIAGSISSLHGNEILKSSIQAALPFLSIPIPLYRLSEIHSKNAFPVFLYMEKPIPSVRHPAGNPAGLHQLKKLFQFFLGTFIIVILKSLSPDYHACLPAVFSIQTNKVLGAPTQRAAV